MTRRAVLRLAVTAGLAAALGPALLAGERSASIRFALTADCHLLGRTTPEREAFLRRFVEETTVWKPDFVIDLGDFACQAGEGTTTQALHNAQLEGLVHHWATLAELPCPVRIAMGNHDVGWISGGDEKIRPEDLIGRIHPGEDITKDEFLAATGMPHRYYSFEIKGYHLIVLDANNLPDANAAQQVLSHDGISGGYFIDEAQKTWLAKDLAAAGNKTKIVFCHQELHHTPPQGSSEGGEVPFRPSPGGPFTAASITSRWRQLTPAGAMPE